MYDAAVNLATNEDLSKQNSHIRTLPPLELNRGFLVNGALPKKPTEYRCFFCHHDSIDEPASNTLVHQENLAAERDYQARKQAAIEEKKTATTTTRQKTVKRPKLKEPYRQCHCHQFRCTSIQTDLGSSCPIKCINPATQERYECDPSGNCTCPLCICTCAAAYGFQIAQAVELSNRLDANDARVSKELQVQSSRKNMSFLLADSMKTVFDEASRNSTGGRLSPKAIETVSRRAATAAALSIAQRFRPEDNVPYIRQMRTEIGPPSNRVHLPTAIDVNGQSIDTVDIRLISLNKSSHRQKNNGLNSLNETPSPRVPLHPYETVYGLPRSTERATLERNLLPVGLPTTSNGSKNEDMEAAIALSLQEQVQSKEGQELEEAIRASLVSSHEYQRTQSLVEGARASNPIIIMSPPVLDLQVQSHDTVSVNTTTSKRSSSTTTPEPYSKRVQKKAYLAATRTTVPTSPAGWPLFTALAGKNAAATDAVTFYKEVNPHASSQDGYDHLKEHAMMLGITNGDDDDTADKKANKNNNNN